MADLVELRRQLESNEELIENLQNLNALLISDNSVSVVSEILSVISLPLLFSLLQSDDQEQVQLTCAVLDKLLSHLPALELVKYGHYIELGLQYPEAKVAKTCLQALLRLSEDKMIQELILAPTMLHLITQLLGGKDLQCATLTTKLLLQFYSQSDYLGMLKDVSFPELEQLLQGSDIVRYRVFDLMVQSCLKGGPKCFQIVYESGILSKLVDDLNTTDPLVKMNCIELLSSLAEMPEGVSFLRSSGVLDTLHHFLTVQDAMAALVIPGGSVLMCLVVS